MINRTPDLIAESIKELMKKKTLAQISVKDICEKAGIQRPTFYYYFKDKYDLVAWIFLSDAKDKDITSVAESTQSLNHMKEEYVFYKRSYEDISQNPLWQYMLDYFVERYTQIALERAGSDVLSPQLSFDIQLYCYGCVAMTKEWLLYDNITSAATEAAMLAASMPEQLKEILNRNSYFC